MGPISRKGIRGLLKRATIFTFVAASIIAASVLVYEFGPPAHIYQDGMWGSYRYFPPEAQNITPTAPEKLVLLEQHSHTIYSDGELTPEQNLQWHIAMGYNACVITDHRTIEGAVHAREIARERYNDTIKVLIGAEYTTDRIHMNIIGISDDFVNYFTQNPPNTMGSPTDEEIQAFIQSVHAHGGIITVNHIIWSLEVAKMTDHPTRDELYAWGVDYIEVINEDVYDAESIDFCQAHGMGMITGTDMHTPGPVYSWTGLNVTDFTEEAIFNELKADRTAILFNATGSPYNFPDGERNPTYLALLPFMYLGEMFERFYDGVLDWAGIVVFLAYAFGAFFMAEGARYLLKQRAVRRTVIEKAQK